MAEYNHSVYRGLIIKGCLKEAMAYCGRGVPLFRRQNQRLLRAIHLENRGAKALCCPTPGRGAGISCKVFGWVCFSGLDGLYFLWHCAHWGMV